MSLFKLEQLRRAKWNEAVRIAAARFLGASGTRPELRIKLTFRALGLIV